MTRQMPQAGKGLGSNNPKRHGMGARRQHPYHDRAPGEILLHMTKF